MGGIDFRLGVGRGGGGSVEWSRRGGYLLIQAMQLPFLPGEQSPIIEGVCNGHYLKLDSITYILLLLMLVLSFQTKECMCMHRTLLRSEERERETKPQHTYQVNHGSVQSFPSLHERRQSPVTSLRKRFFSLQQYEYLHKYIIL